ncbi:MAG TPA: tol-pal system-associated acyl-CoA thioesterase [Steroidobacteraceae bacterium]|nr:tol-pal system-associated acyl-CoA thioesterase [Steroidobacteraceae bacterium]
MTAGSPGEFSWRARVYWEDTDGGGVVYYANYLKFMERARTEWLRAQGHSQAELAETFGFVFAVVEVKVNYRRPARLDDELVITCLPVPEGRASVRFKQTVKKGDQTLADGEVRVACVDAKSFRPRPLPDFINPAA